METNTDFLVRSKLDMTLRRMAMDHRAWSAQQRDLNLKNLESNGTLLKGGPLQPEFDDPISKPSVGDLITIDTPDWNAVGYVSPYREEYELSNGSPAGYYKRIHGFDPQRQEANIGAVVGKWFNRTMIPYDAPGANPYMNAYSYCFGDIQGVNTQSDRYVKLRIKLSMPLNYDTLFYVNRGNAGIHYADLLLTAASSVSYKTTNDNIQRGVTRATLAREVDHVLTGHLRDIPSNEIIMTTLQYIPRGAWDIQWGFYLLGEVSCSSDLIQLDPARTDQYAVSMIDLRHAPNHNAYGLLIDPFDHMVPPPPGGIVIDVVSEVYDAVE